MTVKCKWRASGNCSWHTTLDSDVSGVYIEVDAEGYAVYRVMPIPLENVRVFVCDDLASAKRRAKALWVKFLKEERFTYDGKADVYIAEGECEGFLINPKLPSHFDNTANAARPQSHQKFNNLPFIQTMPYASPEAVEGKFYHVRCLDGGAWDRATLWGGFFTLAAAVECCKTGPAWRKPKPNLQVGGADSTTSGVRT